MTTAGRDAEAAGGNFFVRSTAPAATVAAEPVADATSPEGSDGRSSGSGGATGAEAAGIRFGGAAFATSKALVFADALLCPACELATVASILAGGDNWCATR